MTDNENEMTAEQYKAKLEGPEGPYSYFLWLKGAITRKTAPPIGQAMQVYDMPPGMLPKIKVYGLYPNGDAVIACEDGDEGACRCENVRLLPPKPHRHVAKMFSPDLVRDEAIRSLCSHLGFEPPAGLTPRLPPPA